MATSTLLPTTQRVGREYRIIDYMAEKDKGFDYFYDKMILKGYRYGKHYHPFDIAFREMGNMGLSRFESFEKLFGRNTIVKCPSPQQISPADGINAVRKFLPMCLFDLEKTEEGVDALDAYTKIWDNKLGTYQNSPRHDWASHPADAFRVLAICATMQEQIETRQQRRAPGSGLGSKRRPWGRAYT